MAHSDSAHIAWLEETSEAIFAKYDIRYYKDTTRAVWPLQGEGYEVNYDYYCFLMTKATAMALKEEPDIVYLHDGRLAEVSLRRNKSGRRNGGLNIQRDFDVLDKKRGSRSGREVILFPVRGNR